MTNRDGMTEQQFLQSYAPGDYPRPSVTADIVIFTVADVPEENYRKLPEKALQVLLIRRGEHPHLGQWALPGGFVRPEERVGDAANRELWEETGVCGGYLEQLYTFSTPGRDVRTWVISCAHMALIPHPGTLNPGGDASEAGWFSVKARTSPDGMQLTLSREDAILMATLQTPATEEPAILENHGLAFDHAKIIATALMRLRAKLEYTDLAFCLMPERFTLSELQQVYEVILAKPLIKAAFRRKIAHLVQPTGLYTERAGHRPSQWFEQKTSETAQTEPFYEQKE